MRKMRALARAVRTSNGGRAPGSRLVHRGSESPLPHTRRALARLVPREPPEARALLARTLFSAVHGIVSLGLEEKLAPMPAEVLNTQLEIVTCAFSAGLRTKARSQLDPRG
ncbi:MAG: hypothetical protein ACR2KT_01410 [Methylocella sp.]